MKYKEKDVYSTGDMAEELGFDDYHRISNYLSKIKAKYVTKKGNTRYYDVRTKRKVITYFKSLQGNESSESKKDKLIEELRTQLRESQQEMASRLDEQKENYERLISAKDDNISNLKDTISNLRDQQKITNDQLKELTLVTKQAQSLNLADKSPEQLKMLKGDAKRSSSDKKKDDSQKESSKKNWWNVFKNNSN